jgi:hypothetical protein
MTKKPVIDRPSGSVQGEEAAFYTRRHLRFGWWAFLGFLTLGIVLESLHGFKVGWYLNVSNATRRLMLTLAHAHGTLLALVNIAFALTLPHLPGWKPRYRGLAANCLLAASLLIPAGFLLGGTLIYSGDPGLGIVLVPIGALLLFLAIFLAARAVTAASSATTPAQSPLPRK